MGSTRDLSATKALWKVRPRRIHSPHPHAQSDLRSSAPRVDRAQRRLAGLGDGRHGRRQRRFNRGQVVFQDARREPRRLARAPVCRVRCAPPPERRLVCSLAQGQGIFLREESGRAVEVSSGTAKIPEEMLEHMKFLFASFDSDSSGAAGLLCGGR